MEVPMEQPVFQTLKESENYWSTMSIEEKKKKIGFGFQKDPLNTNHSIWGTSTVELLRILLCDLYQIRDIYSRFSESVGKTWISTHNYFHYICLY